MVTEHQQLQLWIELRAPLFDPVTAVVYFTLKEEEYTQHITTHSVLTENTAMIFQMESHDIPQRFRKEDFLVQVALQVGKSEGSVVPRILEQARTTSKELAINSRDERRYIAVKNITGEVLISGNS